MVQTNHTSLHTQILTATNTIAQTFASRSNV
jgi:hypothetical protein